MNIEKIWTDYCSHMAEIQLYKRNAKEVAKNAIKELHEYETEEVPKLKKLFEASNSKVNIDDATSAGHAMWFSDPISGENITYGIKNISIEDAYLNIKLQLNKQYQWLLTEAYEEFEDYLEKVYAYYGRKEDSFWPLKDYGNFTLSEVSNMNYQCYVEQAEKKRDRPHSILKRFRNHFIELKTSELNNKLDIDLRFAIIVIEKLRHIIVHKGGKVDSKDDFIKSIAEKYGQLNNGKIPKETKDKIDIYFGENEYSNLITILDFNVKNGTTPINIEFTSFDDLINYLMGEANLIYNNIKNDEN